MDCLRPESLDWSLTHVLKYGDTDIVPIPFEYGAIRHCWNGIRDFMSSLDIGSYECRPFQKFLVPKPQGGFRVTIQLDPLDTLFYTALVFESAEAIEHQRTAREQRIACSYRVKISAQGDLFQAKTGWNDFHQRSDELANSGKYQHVVLADIADFYNQISHHRVTHAFEEAGCSRERATGIENFLMNLTGGHSRGIPVGPSGSILIAEAILNDVDTFLLRRGYIHTRYVDDFRIFCTSKQHAHRALHDLADYLYASHKLALQANKTRLVVVDEFAKSELLDPERLEQNEKTAKINELVTELEETAGYGNFTEEDLPSEDVQELVRENILDLFSAALRRRYLPLGLTRYLLHRATELRTNVIQGQVLENIEKLAPVMRDVGNYMIKATPTKDKTRVTNALVNFIENSDIAFIPFLRLWTTHVLEERFATECEQDLIEICQSADTRNTLGVRPFALAARRFRYLDWVRQQRDTWQNHGPWDRRAILWSAAILPDDERKHWLARIQNAGDNLDRAIALTVVETI